MIRQQIRHYVFEPKEQLTATDTHGAERNRRAFLTGGVSTAARIVQISTSLITVPLTLSYLGTERFGLWMTISSVLAMASFADFGVGNGVLNTVAKCFGKDDIEGVRKALSNGFAILGSIALLLFSGFCIVYPHVNWGNFFKVVSPQARLEAGEALAVFAACFALNIAIDTVQRVQLGLQQGYRYSLWQLCGSLLGLLAVLTGIWLHVGLPVLIMGIAGAPVIATTMNALHFFGFARPDLRPSMKLLDLNVVAQIARLGGLFFVLQVVVAISFSADNFIIARFFGAAQVPEYSIPQRMFALIAMMSNMLVAPLWPAYGEAISRGHIHWVQTTLKRSLLLVAVASSIASGILLLLSQRLIHLWVGSRIHPSMALLIGLSVWTVIACCGDALAMFLNGAEIVRLQVIVATVFGLGCVVTKIAFVHYFGIVGVPWSTIFAYLLLNAIPYCIAVPRMLRRLNSPPQSPMTIAVLESQGTVDSYEART
jgi:O-antigen/teichoic acid export membrane protein